MTAELQNFRKILNDAYETFFKDRGYNPVEIHLGQKEKAYLTNISTPENEEAIISDREPDFCYGYLIIWEDKESCLYFE